MLLCLSCMAMLVTIYCCNHVMSCLIQDDLSMPFCEGMPEQVTLHVCTRINHLKRRAELGVTVNGARASRRALTAACRRHHNLTVSV